MKHWFTGWPGAVCLHCCGPDPMEIALADEVYDPETGTWKTSEDEMAAIAAGYCSGRPNSNCPCSECQEFFRKTGVFL